MLLPGKVARERLLDDPRKVVVFALAHLLQQEQLQRCQIFQIQSISIFENLFTNIFTAQLITDSGVLMNTLVDPS